MIRGTSIRRLSVHSKTPRKQRQNTNLSQARHLFCFHWRSSRSTRRRCRVGRMSASRIMPEIPKEHTISVLLTLSLYIVKSFTNLTYNANRDDIVVLVSNSKRAGALAVIIYDVNTLKTPCWVFGSFHNCVTSMLRLSEFIIGCLGLKTSVVMLSVSKELPSGTKKEIAVIRRDRPLPRRSLHH